MSFDFSTLITDRTQSDVDRAISIVKRITDNIATTDEQKQLYAGLLKGTYDFTDFNRVTACMEYLDAELRKLGYESGYKRIRIARPDVPGPGRLPDGYKELEYIESTGAQYISVPHSIDDNTEVTCDFQFTRSTGANQIILGGADVSLRYLNSSGRFAYYRGGTSSTFSTDLSLLERHVVKIGTKECTLDGEVLKTSASYTAQPSFFAFAYRGTSGAASNFANAKCYGLEVRSAAVPVFSGIPCKASSGEVGLYDEVSGTFYGNDGTGNFVAGPEKPPDLIPNSKDPCRWYREDNPTQDQISRYLSNVASIRGSLPDIPGCPLSPSDFTNATTRLANDIETIFLYVDTIVQNMAKTINLGWSMGIAHIGLYGGL